MDFTALIKGANQLFGMIGGAGSAASGLSSLFGGTKRAQRTAFNYQKKLMDYSIGLQKDLFGFQNDINVKNWNMQNEYNSPTAQMQRYQDAGLNTNLIYGGNGSVAGNAEGIASASGGSPNVSMDAKVMSGLAQKQLDLARYTQMQEQARQNGIAQSQMDLNGSLEDYYSALARNIDPNSQSNRDMQQAMTDLYKKNQEQVGQIIQELRTRNLYLSDSLYYTNKNLKQQYESALWNFNNIMPLQKEQIDWMNKKLSAEVDYLVAKKGLTKFEAQNLVANAAYMRSLKSATDAQTDFNKGLWKNPNYFKATIAKAIGDANYWIYRSRNEHMQIPYLQGGFFGTGLSIPNLIKWFGGLGVNSPTPEPNVDYYDSRNYY